MSVNKKSQNSFSFASFLTRDTLTMKLCNSGFLFLSALPSPEWVNLLQHPPKSRGAQHKHFSPPWEPPEAAPAPGLYHPGRTCTLLREVCSASWGLERIRTKTAATAFKCQSAQELGLGGVMTNPSIHLTSPGATCEVVTENSHHWDGDGPDLYMRWEEGAVAVLFWKEPHNSLL